MPDRHRAPGARGRQITGQPSTLVGVRTATADHGTRRVEDDDVPGPKVVRVPARTIRSGRRPEVAEVAGQSGTQVVMVARRRPGPVDEAAPARVVAVPELRGGSGRIGVVTGREDRAPDPGDEVCRGTVGARPALRDVARPDQDRIRTGRRRVDGRRRLDGGPGRGSSRRPGRRGIGWDRAGRRGKPAGGPARCTGCRRRGGAGADERTQPEQQSQRRHERDRAEGDPASGDRSVRSRVRRPSVRGQLEECSLEARGFRLGQQSVEPRRGIGDKVHLERADRLLQHAPHRFAEVRHDPHQGQSR